MAGYYSATRQHRAAAPLADFCTAAYSPEARQHQVGLREGEAILVGRTLPPVASHALPVASAATFVTVSTAIALAFLTALFLIDAGAA